MGRADRLEMSGPEETCCSVKTRADGVKTCRLGGHGHAPDADPEAGQGLGTPARRSGIR